MKKRLLALLLCLVMVIGLVPVALADGEAPTVKTTLHFCYLGGGTDTTQSLPVGEKATQPTAPNKTGYTWDGKWWIYGTEVPGNNVTSADAEKGQYWNFETYEISDTARADVYLFPGYTENNYKVVFDANGGTGTMADQTFTGSEGYTLLAPNAFKKADHTFTGWGVNTTQVKYSDRCAITVANQADFTLENGVYTLTLHAIWVENSPTSSVTITYKPSAESKTTMVETADAAGKHTPVSFPATWSAPAGKKFAGTWQDASGKQYTVGTEYTFTANTTLYPVYENDTNATIYKVRYDDFELWRPVEKKFNVNTDIMIDPNGGKVSYKLDTNAAATQITKEETIFVTANITLAGVSRTGYKFEGWNYNETTRTFTAVWAKPKYNVTFYCYNHGKTETKEFTYNWVIKIDPNGGTYDGAKWFLLRDECTIADPTRTGYKFYGWVIDDSVPGTYTFTAVWNNNYYYNSYSIYYYDYDDCKSEYANFPYGTSVVIDPNGGTAKLSGTSFSTKQSFNIYRDYTLTDASRSGYTFYGWDLTKSGSTYYFTAMWSRYKSDVPYMLNGTDHYAYIKGYPNGSFKPTDTITRAEAATIFYRLLTDSTRKAYATTYNSFKDVPATAWYNTAVSTMAKLGIVNGGADGYFRPNDPITRAEIAAMIARCDGAYYTGSSTVFSDTYGHWAAGYIDRAYELGWINGYGTTYAPDRYISRAETVAVLNRVLNRAPQYTSDLTRNYTTFSDVATSAWYYLDVEEAANSHTYTRKSNADYETWTKLIADPSWF